jgi:TatD DNase family protein
VIDIGANLLNRQFADDLDDVLQRARNVSLSFMLVTTTDLMETSRAIELSSRHDDLACTAGVHPHEAKDVASGWIDQLKRLATEPEVLAIGETGLDFNRNFSPPESQREVFRAQIELGAELALPLFVHDRDSDGEVAAMLAPFSDDLVGVVAHCFTGNHADLDRFLDAGYYIGITGWVCDARRGDELRNLVPEIPLERLLIETDAPFLLPDGAPSPTRHEKRNEPCLLPYIAAKIAELTDTDVGVIVDTTSSNARQLLKIVEPSQ